MHVAYVVSFAFPNMSAGTRRVIGISQALVHAGIDVTIYSAGDGNGSAANLAGLPNNVSVFYSGDRSNNSLLSARLIPPFFFGRKMSKILSKRRHHFDTMLLYSGYTPMLLRLLLLGIRFKKRLFFDAVEWASTGKALWKSPYYANVEFAMRFLVPRCAGVICISSYLEEWYQPRTRVLRVPAIYSVPMFTLNCNFPQKPSKKNPIKITYLGNSDHDHVTLICEFLQDNLKEFDCIQLHIAGSFGGSEIVRKTYSEDQDNTQIVLHGPLSQKEGLDLLRGCHFSIFLREVNPVTSAGFPTKFVQAFSNSIPVITNSSSDLDLYLRDGYNCIKVFELTQQALYDALRRIVALSGEQYKVLAKGAHHCASSCFDPSVHSDNLLNFFQRGSI